MFDEAIQEYQGVLERDPSHVKALFNLGTLYVQLGDYNKGIGFFKNVLAIDEKKSEAWNNLGSIFEITGQPEEAIKAYQKSLELNPYQEEANINLAQIQYENYRSKPDIRKKEELIRRLHFVLSINPHNTRAQHLLHELTK